MSVSNGHKKEIIRKPGEMVLVVASSIRAEIINTS